MARPRPPRIQLADAIAREAKLLLEQLFVCLGMDRVSRTDAGRSAISSGAVGSASAQSAGVEGPACQLSPRAA